MNVPTACKLALASLSFAALAGATDVSVSLADVKTDDSTPEKAVYWIAGAERPPTEEESYTISQKGTQFNPPFLVVPAGSSVAMPNDDDVAHNVFSFSEPKNFNLGIYPKGQSKSVVFDAPGLVEIYCSIHQHMSASVLVVPSASFAVGDESGAGLIEDVSPGRYVLGIWRADRGFTEIEIDIPDQETVEVNVSAEIEYDSHYLAEKSE